nr:MAG TPA: hypothetical protein [Caudoviricetes sp.]
MDCRLPLQGIQPSCRRAEQSISLSQVLFLYGLFQCR